MTRAFVMRDGRLLARIIHLTHRFGCSYTHVEARQNEAGYLARIAVEGPPDALRRLGSAIQTIITDDKETSEL